MSTAKLKRPKAAGWKTGSAEDFLQLSDEEVKLMLTDAIKASRKKRGLSQIDLARKIGSSQSRVAKIEAVDPSVSLDLIVRAFFATGATRKELRRAFGAGEKLPDTSKRRRGQAGVLHLPARKPEAVDGGHRCSELLRQFLSLRGPPC